jgi:hypothetical protein
VDLCQYDGFVDFFTQAAQPISGDDEAYAGHRRALAASPVWRRKVVPELERLSVAPPQELRLRPTARSQFR